MNINNGKTGNVNIPGALHSTGGDGDGQVGGVVAYAGDVYDEILGKNQKEINQTLLDGSGDSNVIAVALNDLNDKTDNLGKDIEDLEKTTSSSLNDLNDKVDNLNDKVDDNKKTTASALADLYEKTDTNEKAVSAALNDLDDKIKYEIKTTNNITNPTKNTYYDLTSLNLTSLDLTSVSLTNINEVVVKFTTDSTTTCTISAPTNVKFIGNSVLYKGSTYILAMFYGVICICEAPSLT